MAMYWAQALAAQTKDAGLQERFAKLAKELEANEAKIIEDDACSTGRACRHWWLLPFGRSDGDRCDAPQRNLQCHHRQRVNPLILS